MGCHTGDSKADAARRKKLKSSSVADFCGVQKRSASSHSELLSSNAFLTKRHIGAREKPFMDFCIMR